MNVEFKFSPLDKVIITAFGLHADARVIRCVRAAHRLPIYEVEYAIKGDVLRREFYEDELTEGKL